MYIRRATPDIRSEAMEESRDFYGLLGFEEVMNLGWVMTLASPSNPTAQVTFMSHDKTAPVVPEDPGAASPRLCGCQEERSFLCRRHRADQSVARISRRAPSRRRGS
jgi:hypothetical protein